MRRTPRARCSRISYRWIRAPSSGSASMPAATRKRRSPPRAARCCTKRLLPGVFDDAAGARFPFAGLHDIEIVVRVAPDAVARAVDRTTPGGEALAVEVEDADHPGIVLGDVDDVVVVDIEERHPDQLGRPHLEQL